MLCAWFMCGVIKSRLYCLFAIDVVEVVEDEEEVAVKQLSSLPVSAKRLCVFWDDTNPC